MSVSSEIEVAVTLEDLGGQQSENGAQENFVQSENGVQESSVESENGVQATDIVAMINEGDLDSVKNWLQQSEENLNKPIVNHQTALHLACIANKLELVEELLKAGARHDIPDSRECTPLHYAAGNGQPGIVKCLLDVGADMEKANKCETPVHLAASHGHTDVLQVMVEKKPDCVEAKDNKDDSPLFVAVRSHHAEAAMYLIKNGAKVTPKEFFIIVHKGYEQLAKAVIRSDEWPTALRGVFQSYSQSSITCFRMLIWKMSDVAEMVLDRCVLEHPEAKDPKKKNYTVLYNYEFLEDFLAAAGNNKKSTTGSSNGYHKVIENSKSPLQWPYYTVLIEQEKFEVKKLPDESRTKELKASYPLNIMVNHKQLKLLTHPVVSSLIAYKWHKFGLLSYISNVLIYILYLALLTSFALTVPNPQTPQCINITQNGTESCSETTNGPGIYRLSVLVLLLALSRLILEVVELLLENINYFFSLTNWVEVAQTICTIFFVSIYNNDCFCALNEQWQVGVAAVFLGWINMILFASRLPVVGSYVVIFIRIVKSFAKLLVLSILLVSAFGLTFYMVFFDANAMRSPFSDASRSLLKTMTMTTGELDYENIFRLNPAGESDHLTDIKYPPISYILWIAFIILMPLLLSNLLTSVAVDDAKEVLEAVELEALEVKMEHLLSVQKFLLKKTVQKCLPKKWKFIKLCVIVHPQKPFFRFTEILFETPYKKVSVIEKVIQRCYTSKVDADENVHKLTKDDKVDDLEKEIKSMKEEMKTELSNMNKTLQELTKALSRSGQTRGPEASRGDEEPLDLQL